MKLFNFGRVLCFALLAISLCNCELVALDNFNKAQGTFNPADPNSDYFFFSGLTNDGLYVANDVEIIQENSFVRLKSVPYTKDVPQSIFGTFSHIPNLQYAKDLVEVGPDERMVYDLRMSGRSKNTSALPYPPELITDFEDDPRLGNAFGNALNPTYFVVADFCITPKAVWVSTEHLPA